MENINKFLDLLERTPLSKLAGFLGILLISSAFVNYTKESGISILSRPEVARLVFGIVLSLPYPLSLLFCWKKGYSKFKSGLTLKANELEIIINVDKIENIEKHSASHAIVLPANNSFVDDCIKDKKSALGAFVLTHYPDKLSELTAAIQTELGTISKDSKGLYPVGTSILLKAPFNNIANIIISAATIRQPGIGIKSDLTAVSECVRNIFELTADKKISKLYLPLLGAGHGGLDKNVAISLLLIAIKHYSKTYHHIRTVEIRLLPGDLKAISVSPCI